MGIQILTKTRTWVEKTEAVLFPEMKIYARKIPLFQEILLFLGLSLAFSLVGVLIPTNEYVGWDWTHLFGVHRVFGFYLPWTVWITDRLTWPLLTGLTFGAYFIAVIRRSVHPFSAAAALLTLQLFWVVFLGQLEGLTLVGLLWLPWLVPLAVLKPQVAVFALFARKSYLIGGLICLLVSFLIFGLWPLDVVHTLLTIGNVGAKHADQDIALGLVGIPISLLLLWFSRGDMDMLMLAGAVAFPYLIPYNLMVAAPAIARLKPGKALLAALLSWLPFSANWIGPGGWYLGWALVAWVWLCLAAKRYPQALQNVGMFVVRATATNNKHIS
jgi:hypothetical protein